MYNSSLYRLDDRYLERYLPQNQVIKDKYKQYNDMRYQRVKIRIYIQTKYKLIRYGIGDVHGKRSNERN